MAKPSLIKLTALFLQVKNSAMKLSGFNIFENSGKNFQLNVLLVVVFVFELKSKALYQMGRRRRELHYITLKVWNDATQGLGTEELDKHDPNRFGD